MILGLDVDMKKRQGQKDKEREKRLGGTAALNNVDGKGLSDNRGVIMGATERRGKSECETLKTGESLVDSKDSRAVAVPRAERYTSTVSVAATWGESQALVCCLCVRTGIPDCIGGSHGE